MMAILSKLTYQLNKMFIKILTFFFIKLYLEIHAELQETQKHKIILRNKNEVTEFILPSLKTCYKQELSSQCGVGI